jgi:hypothetical protein
VSPRRGRAAAACATALACAASLAPPAAAGGFSKARTAAGPSPDVLSLGGLSMARDGTGAVAFLQRDGGQAHVFVSRLASRRPTAPVRVDTGQLTPSSDVRVAAADDGQTVVTWINGGQIYGAVEARTGDGFSAPKSLCLCGPVSDPSLDVSRFGTAYLTFTAPGAGGHDVRVATFDEGKWKLLGTPLDIEPGHDAGGASAAASSDGTGIAAFTERESGGVTRVYERRLLRTKLSEVPRRASLGALNGHSGGSADGADVDIQDDSSYAWVTFREGFRDGGGAASRTIAHRLAGSRFDLTSPIDGLSFPASQNAVAATVSLAGRGYGMALTTLGSNELMAGVLTRSRDPLQPTFEGAVRLQKSQPSPLFAVPSSDDSSHGLAVWQRSGGGKTRVVARYFDGRRFAKAVKLSPSGAGQTAAELGLDSESDDAEDHVVAFVQGPPGARRIQVVAYVAAR